MFKKYKVSYEAITRVNAFDRADVDDVEAYITEQKNVFVEIENEKYIDTVIIDSEQSKVNLEAPLNSDGYEDYQVSVDVNILKVEEID